MKKWSKRVTDVERAEGDGIVQSRQISFLDKQARNGVQCKQVWSNAYRKKKFRITVPDE